MQKVHVLTIAFGSFKTPFPVETTCLSAKFLQKDGKSVDVQVPIGQRQLRHIEVVPGSEEIDQVILESLVLGCQVQRYTSISVVNQERSQRL